MYIVGFAETVQSLLRNNEEKIIDDGLWDIRLIGLGKITCCICAKGGPSLAWGGG